MRCVCEHGIVGLLLLLSSFEVGNISILCVCMSVHTAMIVDIRVEGRNVNRSFAMCTADELCYFVWTEIGYHCEPALAL